MRLPRTTARTQSQYTQAFESSWRAPSPDLDDVIVERTGNIPEPVRCAGGDNEHVSLRDAALFAIPDGRAANLTGRGRRGVLDGAAGHERCRAFEDVDDVRVERVDFRHPRAVAMAGVNHVVAPVLATKEDAAFCKRGADLAAVPVRNCSPAFHRANSPRQGSRSGLGDVLILLRCIAADANRANHATVDFERHAALQRCCTWKRKRRHPSVANLILEDFARSPEDRS